MSDFWDNFVPLLVAICFMFFLYGLGKMTFTGMEKTQARYEQCVEAGMQWYKGSCLK